MMLSTDEYTYRFVRVLLNEAFDENPAPFLNEAGLMTAEGVTTHLMNDWSTPADEAREWAGRWLAEPYNLPLTHLSNE